MSDHALTLPPPVAGSRGAPERLESALARRADVGCIDWEEMKRVCGAAIKSGILPRSITREDQAVAIALKARELGVPPMQGFSTIHLIQGVATCSANLMLGLAYKRLPEFSIRLVERTAARCVMEFRRDARREWLRVSYTIEEARAAGLTSKDNWKNHPAAMLNARVVGIGCRLVAPDVFAGLYTPEEIDEGPPPDAYTIDPVDPATGLSEPPRVVEVDAPEPATKPVEPERAGAPAPVVVTPDAPPAPVDPVSDKREALARFVRGTAGEAAEVKRVSTALGIPMSGRRWSDLSADEVERLHRHTIGGVALPKPATSTAPATARATEGMTPDDVRAFDKRLDDIGL